MACLSNYGGQLAAFLDGFGPASSMPYLSDIARLEWSIYECQNIGDEKTLAAEDWATGAGLDAAGKSFNLVKAHRFIDSEYPLLDLWHVAMGQESSREIDIESGGTVLLVIRPATEVLIHLLTLEEYRFLSLLEKGASVLDAAIAVEWAHENSPLAAKMRHYAIHKFFSAGEDK